MCSSRAPALSGMSQPAKHHFLIRHRASSDVIDPFANDKSFLHLPPNLCNVQVAVQALGTPFRQATASIKGPHCCCRASTNASILPLTWIGCGAALEDDDEDAARSSGSGTGCRAMACKKHLNTHARSRGTRLESAHS